MSKLKKIIALGLIATIFYSMKGTAAFVVEMENINENENKNELKNEKDSIVIIEDTDISVPDSVIKELIKEYPEAGQITISEYGKSAIKQRDSLVSPGSGVYYSNVSKTQLERSVLVRTNFVTSVAKGETKVQGISWSSTLSSNISGRIDSNKLGIPSSLTVSYSESQPLSGPSEASPNNSRCFYVKFYENKGTYTATCHDPLAGWYIKYPESGTYTEPAFFICYYVDLTVS